MKFRRLTALISVAAIAAVSCTSPDNGDGNGSEDPPPNGETQNGEGEGEGDGNGDDVTEVAASLVTYDSCDALTADFHDHLWEVVLAAYENRYVHRHDGGFAGDVVMESEAMDGSVSGVPAGQPDFSGTNVQEAGVDEPDFVKTDGNYLYTLIDGTLSVYDTSGSNPTFVTSQQVGQEFHELMLHGDRLLLMGRIGNNHFFPPGMPIPTPMPVDPIITDDFVDEREFVEDGEVDRPATSQPNPGAFATQMTTLRIMDISDPANLETLQTMEVEGDVLTAREHDGTVRFVTNFREIAARTIEPYANEFATLEDEEILERLEDVIYNSDIVEWLPRYSVYDANGNVVVDNEPAVDCRGVALPQHNAGLGFVTLYTINLDEGFAAITRGTTALFTEAAELYATPDSLYVALAQPVERSELGQALNDLLNITTVDVVTDIHRFDLEPEVARYVTSGQVVGFLYDQWAMSEYDGHLRVASTINDDWWGGNSENMVTTLDVDTMTQVGFLRGLGPTERIYAVRFVEDLAYVVTFRQIDPFYTIDLSDPADPTVLGELKILGYSAYLHPISDTLVLGVGQDATEDGFIQGVQVSLFDVSDLTDPTLLDQIQMDYGSSEVEFDHRAFLHWPNTGLTVVPFQTYWHQDDSVLPSGAFTFTADEDGINRTVDLSHETFITNERDQYRTHPILRSVVIGDSLHTISHAGIATYDMDDLTNLGWLPHRQS